MSGVIDKNHVQWERCTVCASWTRLQDLGFLPKGILLKLPHGADVCLACANSDASLNRHVQPAKTWEIEEHAA